MKDAPSKRTGKSTKENAALLLSFHKVRILHYAAAHPVHRVGILERLHSRGCRIDAPTLDRILLRMVRNGWLRSSNPPRGGRGAPRDFSLTPKGREVLKLARERLKELVTA